MKYLLITQEQDGHWSQNSGPEGIPYWTGIEKDQAMLPKGKGLRLEMLAHATIHRSKDDWKTQQTIDTRDTKLGIYVADLPVEKMKKGKIDFTFFWPESQNWEGRDFFVEIV